MDLPVLDLRNPGLEVSSFISVRSVIDYVETTPSDDLSWPGQLFFSATTGTISRQHRLTGIPLPVLTKMAIDDRKRKGKKKKRY